MQPALQALRKDDREITSTSMNLSLTYCLYCRASRPFPRIVSRFLGVDTQLAQLAQLARIAPVVRVPLRVAGRVRVPAVRFLRVAAPILRFFAGVPVVRLPTDPIIVRRRTGMKGETVMVVQFTSKHTLG